MIPIIKQILFKVLVVLMIVIGLSFFTARSVSASKMSRMKSDKGFFYSGTQEGEYTVEASFWDKLLNALAEIANYLLGIMTLGTRGIIVGLIEIMEIILTIILDPQQNIAKMITDSISKMDGYTQDVVNIEKIIFNEVKILDANIFKIE